MENKNVVLTEGAPWKGILLFALPVFAGQVLQQLYSTVDAIIVGNFVSEAALASVGTVFCLTMFFLSIANGFSTGACVILAQLFGAKKYDKLRHTANGAIVLLWIIGLLAAAISLVFCGPIIKYVLGVKGEILTMAVLYFRIYSVGLIFQFGYNICACVLRAVGDSKASLYFLLVSSILNIILDVVFVAWMDMGVAGAAWATNLSQLGSCAAAFIYMYKKYEIFRFKLTDYRFDKETSINVLKTGLPMCMQQMIVSMGFIFIQHAVNTYGDAMTASFTVAQRVENYLHVICLSLMITMSTYAGQNTGARKPERIVKGVMQATLISVGLTLALGLLSFIFARQIIGWFALGEEATVFCYTHVRVSSILVLMFAAYFPMLGMFQGVGDAFYSTRTATIVLLVRTVAVYTLCYVPFLGYRIIWWSQLISYSVGIILAWGHFFGGKWKKKKLLAE
ncbi:MAG: MATE family efflux transporter [Lachnospiraceae bacterium]|nr:MATE family efflux transporter [Lachnospiraceae bacterium]